MPSPGWKRTEQTQGSGEEAIVQKVTWAGGKVPTGEDAVFRFNASTSGSKRTWSMIDGPSIRNGSME